jgi:hypothetical protein
MLSAPPRFRPSSRSLLARVLETPQLAAQVRALPGALLAKLIAQIGLEDAGELVALASTQQLADAFDEDLWHSPCPGEDASFDSQRFLLWLEVLAEAGEAFVAERLAELPPDLVTLAFHRHLLVLSLDDLRDELTADDDDAQAAEKAFESCLSEELDDYQLIWRGGDGWDSVLSALLALDRDHHALAADLLERCAHLSREHIADNGGLYAVLSAEEMLETDLAADREARRAERGYVAPSAAAAFLRLALRAAASDPSWRERDATTRAYFRELSKQPLPARAAEPSPRQDLVQLLADSGIREDVAAPRLLASRAAPREPLVIAGLRALGEHAPAKLAERSEELAYLSNVLLAGATVDGRRLRPGEAVEHALSCVSLGLSLAGGAQKPTAERAAALLAELASDGLFRLAFARAREPGLENRRQIDEQALARVRSLLKTLKV